MKTTCNFSVDYLLISDKCKKKIKISGYEVGNAGASKADFWHAYIKKGGMFKISIGVHRLNRVQTKQIALKDKKNPQTNKIN